MNLVPIQHVCISHLNHILWLIAFIYRQFALLYVNDV